MGMRDRVAKESVRWRGWMMIISGFCCGTGRRGIVNDDV